MTRTNKRAREWTSLSLISFLFMISSLSLSYSTTRAIDSVAASSAGARMTPGQWVQTSGPYGGSIHALLANGSNLFAGTEIGVFLSTDNGRNWTAVNNGLTNSFIRSLAVGGNNLFAGTATGGIFLSTNNGQNWTAVNNGLTSSGINSLAVSGNNIYAGTGAGVFLSANNGQNWTAVNNGLTSQSIISLAVSGNNVFAGTGAGVFLSTDNGRNWTAVNNGLPNSNILSLAVRGNNLFAGTFGRGVFLSTNNGRDWTAVNNGLFSKEILCLAVSANYLFAGTSSDGVFRGSDFVSSASTVSAASYGGKTIAIESIAASFGSGFSTNTQIANTLPLPTSLAGTSVRVLDSAGNERLAPLFFVSPTQINFQIPPGAAPGDATATIASNDLGVSISPLQISLVAPGLFTANADGQGVPAAVVLRIKPDGRQIYEAVSRFDQSQNKIVPIPIELGPAGEQVFLLLYGTGIRYCSSLSAVAINIGGIDAQITYAGPQNDFIGLDQINARLSPELAGRGDVLINLRVDGIAANPVLVNIK